MCSVRGLLSGRFGQSEGRTGGQGNADSFVFSVSANEKNKTLKVRRLSIALECYVSTVLRKNGWWEEAESSREHSGIFLEFNEGHVKLPRVWFVLFPFSLCLCVWVSVCVSVFVVCASTDTNFLHGSLTFQCSLGGAIWSWHTHTETHHFLWYGCPPVTSGLVSVGQCWSVFTVSVQKKLGLSHRMYTSFVLRIQNVLPTTLLFILSQKKRNLLS